MPDEPDPLNEKVHTGEGQPLDIWPPSSDEEQKPDIVDATQFFKVLKGDWTLDFYASTIPGSDGMEIEQDIVLKMEDDGSFLAAVPAIVARVANSAIPDLAIAARIAVSGKLSVELPLTEEGVSVIVSDAKMLESQFTIAGDKMGGDISLLVSPLVAQLIEKINGHGVLNFQADADDTILKFSTGPDFEQIFKRPTPSAELSSFRYLNCYGAMHNTVPLWQEVGFDMDRLYHRTTGEVIAEPHWGKDINAPVCYMRGDIIEIEVKIAVHPAGTEFVLFGRDTESSYFDNGTLRRAAVMAMNFQSGVVVSTGQPQKVKLVGKHPLPANRIGQHLALVHWSIHLTESGIWGRVNHCDGTSARTGPHRIYTTYGKPIPESSLSKISKDEDNFVTERRLLTVINCCADVKAFLAPPHKTHPADLDRIATAIQTFVNSKTDRFALKFAPFKKPSAPGTTRELWDMLDAISLNRGNCWEATTLMELMLHIIGIDAVQTHVFARSNLESIEAGENLSYRKHTGTTKDLGQAETRLCEKHKKPRNEWLAMNFSPMEAKPLLNEGEGTVKVGECYYAGLTHLVGRPDNGRNAVQDLLLKLEDDAQGLDPRRTANFQVWIESDGAGSLKPSGVCEFAEKEGGLIGVEVPQN